MLGKYLKHIKTNMCVCIILCKYETFRCTPNTVKNILWNFHIFMYRATSLFVLIKNKNEIKL